MQIDSRSFVKFSMTAALLACAPAMVAQATQAAEPSTVNGTGVSAVTETAVAENTPKLDLTTGLDLVHTPGVTYSASSSSLEAVDADSAGRLNLPDDATQPPPRRRYGRPRYNDSSHNPDGSDKYAFIAGAGLTIATGNTYHYLNTSYSYQVGAGRNFSKNFSLLAQFDWDNFGFNGRTLLLQGNLYDPDGSQGINGYLDGNSHVWSFSINPVYNIYTRQGLGRLRGRRSGLLSQDRQLYSARHRLLLLSRLRLRPVRGQ